MRGNVGLCGASGLALLADQDAGVAVGEEGVGVGESLSLCDERWNVFLRRDVRESGVEDLRGAKSCIVGGFRVLEFVLRFPFPIPFASSNP